MTAQFLIEDKVPFHLVVEPQEETEYSSRFGKERVLVLPFSNLGLGGIPARNWCWEHAKAAGHERHWILDDNIRRVRRWFKGKRIPCSAGVALKVVEDFVDRYENIAIAGLNYSMFAIPTGKKGRPPFSLNCHVYSCLLILNSLSHRWRGRYNEDTDLCLQVLSDNWCTVLVNAFLIEKMATMTMKGGNSDQLYKADGRLKMARSLERMWPGVATTYKRFDRAQHCIKDGWKRFDTPLKRKPGLNLEELPPNEYGMKIVEKTVIKSERLRNAMK